MPGYSGGPVVTTLVCLFISHARLRVHWAPGIPHALVFPGRTFLQKLGRIAPRDRGGLSTNFVVIPAKAGSSIPEAAENKSRGRGVLDRPVRPDDDSSFCETTKQSIVTVVPTMNCFAEPVGDPLARKDRLRRERISALPGRDAVALYRSTKSCADCRKQVEPCIGRSFREESR
jgi:hypothetical protein